MTDTSFPRSAAALPVAGAAAREWRSGWPVVLTGVLGNTLMSLAAVLVGPFMASLEQAFGWSRAEISLGLTVFSVVGMVCGPLVGAMVDRWGSRRIALPGILATGAGIVLFSTATGSISNWLLLWVTMALANQFVGIMVWSAAVSKVFTVSRGFALGVMMTGNGIVVMLAPVLANLAIEAYGWRTAFLLLGVGWAGVVAIVTFFLFFDRKDAPPAASGRPAAPVAPVPGLSVGEGLRSPVFWKLAVTIFAWYLVSFGMLVHMIPILGAGGLSRDAAVLVAGSTGIAMIAGKLVTGLLADRLQVRYIAAFCVALPAVPFLLLLSPTSSVGLRLATIALFGFPYGALLPMIAYLVTRYFGMRNFGAIFGFVGSILAVGIAIGPVMAGAIYDHTHSYAPLLIAAIPICLVGGALLLSLGRYPDFTPAKTVA